MSSRTILSVDSKRMKRQKSLVPSSKRTFSNWVPGGKNPMPKTRLLTCLKSRLIVPRSYSVTRKTWIKTFCGRLLRVQLSLMVVLLSIQSSKQPIQQCFVEFHSDPLSLSLSLSSLFLAVSLLVLSCASLVSTVHLSSWSYTTLEKSVKRSAYQDTYGKHSLMPSQQLARVLLPIFDPDAVIEDEDESQRSQFSSIPVFTKPKSLYCKLPGGTFLFHMGSLGLLHNTMNCKKRWTLDPTGRRYCAVYTSQAGLIEGITFFGIDMVEVWNLQCLVGLPEKYVNNLCDQYDERVIPDFISFCFFFPTPLSSSLSLSPHCFSFV